MFPIETNAERPSPRDSAASSSASPSAPLWEEKPMLPGGAEREANVALSLTAAEEMPRQLGPSSRAPCARTSASSASWRSSPSGPTSANPAEMTQTARTPASRTDSTASEHRCRPGRR